MQSAAIDIRDANNYLSQEEVRTILTSTGDPIKDLKSGITTPRVNLQAAVDAIEPIVDTQLNIEITDSQLSIYAQEGEDVAAGNTTNPTTIKLAKAITDTSYVYMIIDANGEITNIGVNKSSRYLTPDSNHPVEVTINSDGTKKINFVIIDTANAQIIGN